MLHALGDHQAVDAVGSEIFHVAIEKTCAFAIQHSVAIANDGAHRGARSCQSAFSHSRGKRAKIGMRAAVSGARLKLIRSMQLGHRHFLSLRLSLPTPL